MKRCLVAVFAIAALAARADDVFPATNWTDKANPLASPDATAGGELCVYAAQYPKSFNYYLDNNSFSAELFSAMYETLLNRGPVALDYEPGLAEKWAVSSDKRTFTFWINPKAKWGDGQPVTAADVQWTFDAVMNPANMTGPHKVALEKFERPEIVDGRQIRFTAKEIHWRNLDAAGGFPILPKHVYEKKDFNAINVEFPVVSGPYRLGTVKEGLYATLERRADWWNRGAKAARGTGNFQTLKFKFFSEMENAYEAFRKGEIDLFAVYSARIWVNETAGERFDRHWIVKQKVANRKPIGFQGFAMNLRRPPFDDVRVRKALCHLLNRARLNSTIMYNQYFLHRSYYEDLYDAATPCPNESIAFDKERARQLLAEAGWKANPKTGLLEKDGKPLHFSFLEREASTSKFLSIFAEDLRDAGIELRIEQKDWASWTKDMDEFNYDMTWAAWGADIFKDPEGMWSSKEADRKGGTNITGFKNKRVDELIEKQKAIFDVNARHAICREIDGIVCREVPYILLWNIDYTRLLHWNKFGTPPTVLGKYGDEGAAYWYWWYDEDSAADLRDAMKKGQSLPKRAPEVVFDKTFIAPKPDAGNHEPELSK
jgi:microcin C transport system substrate-binding protein